MKYVANPVIVDAFKITRVKTDEYNVYHVKTEDEVWRTPTNEMMSRFKPTIDDYWVIQEDGYEYLNPADVFLRKYSIHLKTAR